METANELGLYAFIQNILSQSFVIQGRFAVLTASGDEINTTNFGQLVQDTLKGFTMQQKYPCALMLPPYETEKGNDKGWSTYRCQLFFLCLFRRTGDGKIKAPDLQTNMSMQTYQQDWKDMREVAGGFVKAFREATRSGTYPVREHNMTPEQYRRVTGIGNDKLNGIHLTYEVQIWNGYNCNSLADYPNGVNITMTDFSPHPLQQQ